MRIKMPAVRIAQADSDTTEPEGAQDILTCGSCQKTFSLSDIVRFIQHKVLQCNKENYGQCFQQQGGGTSDDRESDDGRPLSLVNTRRPTISAPITARKPSASRVHTPPQTSPAELLGDGASSTPKSLADENEKQLETQTTQERMDMSSSHDEENSVSSGRPLNKKLRTEVADAESNTTHSEPSNYVCSTCKSRFHSAWRLVQHVQHSHGVKIYLESGGGGAASASTSASSGSSSGNGNNSAALLAASCNSLNVLTQNHQTSASSSISSASMKQLKDLSGSSTCSSTSENSNRDRSLSAAVAAAAAAAASQNSMVVGQNLPPPGLRHHPLLPPHDLHTNPFGLLRMPMPPLSQGPAPPVPPLFSRPHPDHFRMEQLVSEQFRHHGLNLAAAAAVAAANSMSNHNQNYGGGVGIGNTISSSERPPSSGGRSISSLPPSSQNLGIEPQMDFYSQRLRQLAGTTSPGAGIAAAANTSSPSPRKQQSPPFASPSPSQLPPTPLTVSNSRPQSMTPPEKCASDLINNGGGGGNDGATITNTPRSSSTPPSKQIQAANEAVHSCEFCGKKFRFQSNLVVHRRAHTGEKPYKCNQCDFACAQNSKLRHHMKIHQTPEDRASNSGSVETLDGDESPEDLEEDEDELGMDEEEDMDDNDFDDGKMEDEAEDLRMSNTKDAIKELGRELGMHSNHHSSASLVGELMDKFGLSNIAQYSEAYKQALQESGNALKLHLSNKDRDNNNSSHLPFPDKLNGLPAALRLREEFAKNMLHQQHQAQSQVPLFHPFDNPFIDQTKRMKLEAYEVSKRIKFEGADSWWNLASGLHRNDGVLFDDLKPKHNVPNAAGQMMQNPMKKEQKRNDTCEFCGKVFKNCSNLTVHRRSHTGEKPYKCELCSYACAQSSKLTRHMKTHGRMGKDVYRCRFCDMPFSVPSTLEKHMRKCVVNQGGGKQAAHQSNGMGGIGLGQNGQTQQTILNNNNNNLSNNNNVNLNNINSNSLSNLSNSSNNNININNNNNNNNNSSIPNIQLGSNPNSLMGSNGLNLSGLVGAGNNGLQIPQMPLIKSEDDNSSIMNIKKETA